MLDYLLFLSLSHTNIYIYIQFVEKNLPKHKTIYIYVCMYVCTLVIYKYMN